MKVVYDICSVPEDISIGDITEFYKQEGILLYSSSTNSGEKTDAPKIYNDHGENMELIMVDTRLIKAHELKALMNNEDR